MKLQVRLLAAAVVMLHAVAAAAAPCFPEKSAVRPDHRLWRLQPELDDDFNLVRGNGTWGTCTVETGKVRDTDGTLVAQLSSCGMSILTPGIVDGHGLQVGVRGERVLAAYGDGPSSTIVCIPAWERPHRARCWIPRDPRYASDRDWSYVVAGRLPKTSVAQGRMLRGEAALAFFRRRTVIAIEDRGSCH